MLSAFNKASVSESQYVIPGVEEPAVINSLGIVLIFLQFFLGDKALFTEYLKVDEVGVACYGRGRLVGAVSVGGGVKGEHLPALGLSLGEKIYEVVRAFSKRANSVRTWQGADGHQDAALMLEAKIF